jgi:type II secretory pathway pseudopilin PulG
LLIVVSIIALLIGILLPALGKARQSARQVVDLANLREHGNGAQAYAAENKQVMPNTKAFYHRAADIGKAKPKIWPHWQYAGPYTTGNGNAATGPTNGIGFNVALTQGMVWQFYQPAFGNYILDAEGIDLLFAEVWSSPGGSSRGNHSGLYRNATSYDGGTQNYLTDTSVFNFQTSANGSKLSQGGLEYDPDNLGWALQGDYRYTVSAIVGQSNINSGPYAGTNFFTGARLGAAIGGTGAASTPWETGQGTWDAWRSFVKTTSFAYPTQKVLFWDIWTENSPGRNYTWPGAKCAVNLVDGSTITVTPYNIMPLKENDVVEAGFRYNEAISTRESYKVNPVGPKGIEGYTGSPAWFAMTTLGPKGRDLGSNAYIGLSQQ